jgi:hypothetical protein
MLCVSSASERHANTQTQSPAGVEIRGRCLLTWRLGHLLSMPVTMQTLRKSARHHSGPGRLRGELLGLYSHLRRLNIK